MKTFNKILETKYDDKDHIDAISQGIHAGDKSVKGFKIKIVTDDVAFLTFKNDVYAIFEYMGSGTSKINWITKKKKNLDIEYLMNV